MFPTPCILTLVAYLSRHPSITVPADEILYLSLSVPIFTRLSKSNAEDNTSPSLRISNPKASQQLAHDSLDKTIPFTAVTSAHLTLHPYRYLSPSERRCASCGNNLEFQGKRTNHGQDRRLNPRV